MRILTVQGSREWLAERGLEMHPAARWGADHHLEIPDRFHSFYFATPQEARRVWSLAHLLSAWFPCDSSLLLVSAVTLFQEHELDAFLASRRALGDMRWIDDVPGGATPGYLFAGSNASNRQNVRELLGLMMAYTFQGYLVRADGRLIIWLGDDVIDVEAAAPGELDGARRIADLLELAPSDWAHELMRRRRTMT